jgi:hypothetical protein
MSAFEDDILRHRERTDHQDELALAYCTRKLDGDALAEAVAMLELGGAA